MTERALLWMNENYPDGFFCCALNGLQNSEGFWVDAVSLNYPLLIHLSLSSLQETITALIDGGASATTPCKILEDPLISGTLGDIAMRVRAMNLTTLDLVVDL